MSTPESTSRRRPLWGNLAATLVGAVLVFSAATKVLAPKAFLASVESYGLFPASYLLLVATGVTALELMLGVLLVSGVYRRLAAGLTLPLMVAFLVLVTYGIAIGLESCGCFGQALTIPPVLEIGLDIVLLALLLVALRHATSVRLGPAGLRHGLAWGSLCVGAAAFLAGGPAPTRSEELAIDRAQLSVLEERAAPPLTLPEEALLFLFSTECDHCWAFASTTESIHRRIPELTVLGVTFGDPEAVATFEADFAPTYPIHVVPSAAFDAITPEYPAAIWISRGQIEKTWVGFVPSHLELANSGGYTVVEGPREQQTQEPGPQADVETPAAPANPFGGPASSRH